MTRLPIILAFLPSIAFAAAIPPGANPAEPPPVNAQQRQIQPPPIVVLPGDIAMMAYNKLAALPYSETGLLMPLFQQCLSIQMPGAQKAPLCPQAIGYLDHVEKTEADAAAAKKDAADLKKAQDDLAAAKKDDDGKAALLKIVQDDNAALHAQVAGLTSELADARNGHTSIPIFSPETAPASVVERPLHAEPPHHATHSPEPRR